jgi:hypothetical protein
MPSVAALNIFILSVRRNVLVCDSCHRGNCVTYEPEQPPMSIVPLVVVLAATRHVRIVISLAVMTVIWITELH